MKKNIEPVYACSRKPRCPRSLPFARNDLTKTLDTQTLQRAHVSMPQSHSANELSTICRRQYPGIRIGVILPTVPPLGTEMQDLSAISFSIARGLMG